MIRQIIKIDEEKCIGCGACVSACHEGAIAMVDGKAKMMREDYCDGLGNCLPTCPTEAITFEERDVPAFNQIAATAGNDDKSDNHTIPVTVIQSQLSQWPVQIKLVPINASYFDGANLLIAADCTAYAYANFHEEFIRNRITLIGCPKLDEENYAEKLTAIIRSNNIKSVTIVRMEVPCCGGIENAAKKALQESGKFIPWNVVTISTDGKKLA